MGRERVTGVCTMKLMHLSDLHIGKRVNEFSMLEDQRAVFEEICHILDEEKVQGVIIAGDVYDRQEPSAQAVQLCDDLICALRDRGLKVFVISGNHDSAARISYGRRVMRDSGIYLSRPYDGGIEEVCLEDEYGPVQVVFTRKGEIADHYIERLCDGYAEDVEFRRAEVRVATSDALEQTIILGRGATRISSRELLMEMSQARSTGTAAAVPKRTGGSTVGDRIPPHVLEKLRRIGK